MGFTITSLFRRRPVWRAPRTASVASPPSRRARRRHAGLDCLSVYVGLG